MNPNNQQSGQLGYRAPHSGGTQSKTPRAKPRHATPPQWEFHESQAPYHASDVPMNAEDREAQEAHGDFIDTLARTDGAGFVWSDD